MINLFLFFVYFYSVAPNRHKNKGEEDQYKIIDNHEAIVGREDFEKVQE